MEQNRTFQLFIGLGSMKCFACLGPRAGANSYCNFTFSIESICGLAFNATGLFFCITDNCNYHHDDRVELPYYP